MLYVRHALMECLFSVRTSGNTFSLWGWLNTGTDCQDQLGYLHPWRYSQALWTHSRAACSQWPCLHTHLDEMTFRGFFRLQPFWDSVNKWKLNYKSDAEAHPFDTGRYPSDSIDVSAWGEQKFFLKKKLRGSFPYGIAKQTDPMKHLVSLITLFVQ